MPFRAEMVDRFDLKSNIAICMGSTPFEKIPHFYAILLHTIPTELEGERKEMGGA